MPIIQGRVNDFGGVLDHLRIQHVETILSQYFLRYAPCPMRFLMARHTGRWPYRLGYFGESPEIGNSRLAFSGFRHETFYHVFGA